MKYIVLLQCPENLTNEILKYINDNALQKEYMHTDTNSIIFESAENPFYLVDTIWYEFGVNAITVYDEDMNEIHSLGGTSGDQQIPEDGPSFEFMQNTLNFLVDAFIIYDPLVGEIIDRAPEEMNEMQVILFDKIHNLPERWANFLFHRMVDVLWINRQNNSAGFDA